MAWTTPKTDWTAGVTKPTATLFNNMGNNLQYLKDSTDATDMYATTTNSGNNYSATLPSAPATGKPFVLKFNADSSGAVNLNINGAGNVAVKKGNGTNFTNAKNNSIYTFVSNGTNFILQGSDSSGDATAAVIVAGYTATSDNGDLTGTGDNAKRYASGTVSSSSGTSNFTKIDGTTQALSTLTVNTLTFTPSVIVIINSGYNSSKTVYSSNKFETGSSHDMKIMAVSTAGTQYKLHLDGSVAYTNSTGFQMAVATGSSNYDWYAWE